MALQVHLNACIYCKVDLEGDGKMVLTETTVGRVLFNQVVPKGYGYVNQLLTKKALRNIISGVLYKCGNVATVNFLDDIKNMGYRMAFVGGLSFNLGDVLIPEEKKDLIAKSNAAVEEIQGQFEMGFITNTERSNQIIDIWTNTNAQLSKILIKKIAADKKGFNSVYMSDGNHPQLPD